MKIGIVQPYFLPYIGYFALINVVDIFVYFDDVQYIRRGWVNRNRIRIGQEWKYLTIPIQKAPLSSKINKILVVESEKKINKLIKSIEFNYRKAPYFKNIVPMVFKYLKAGEYLSKINISTTNEICAYLDIKTEILKSSNIDIGESLKGEERIIEICKSLGGTQYINPIGGINLYSCENFKQNNIKLNFLKIDDIVYREDDDIFIPNLSIIDVLMWNSQREIKEMLNKYTLI